MKTFRAIRAIWAAIWEIVALNSQAMAACETFVSACHRQHSPVSRYVAARMQRGPLIDDGLPEHAAAGVDRRESDRRQPVHGRRRTDHQ